MDASALTVQADRDGRVCVLSARGDLDLTSAAEFMQCATGALDWWPDRLVLELAGLTFVDCTGARTLAAVTRAVPPGCQVIVGSLSLPAGRILGLLGLDLERPHRAARQEVIWADRRAIVTRMLRVAEQVAVTEDQVAVTFAQLAARQPARAGYLSAQSRVARQHAIRCRQWARNHVPA
jgi:anti-anti-sigma factor